MQRCRHYRIHKVHLCEGKCDYRTDRHTHTQTDAGQSDPYVPLCFAGDTKGTFILLPLYELAQAKRGLMVIFEISVRYISVFYCCKSFYWYCTSTLENKPNSILLKRLSCMLDRSHCDVIYYVIHVICSHNVKKAISPLFAWASSYITQLYMFSLCILLLFVSNSSIWISN